MKTILELTHIQKYYGSEGTITKAINDISFCVQEGEFLSIMGASGSGKTTLLNCISTIDTVSAGHIYLDGTDVTELRPKALARFRRENLGFIFQDFNLLDTLTISENIALTLAIRQTPAKEVRYRAGRNSAAPAPGPSFTTRSCFWRTNRPARSTAIRHSCFCLPSRASMNSFMRRF